MKASKKEAGRGEAVQASQPSQPISLPLVKEGKKGKASFLSRKIGER